MIELSEKFLQFWRSVFNKELYEQNKRIEIIEEAKELPSPLPRLSLNIDFINDLRQLLKRYYPEAQLLGVTNTNSMEPVVDAGHWIVIIPFKDFPFLESKKSIVEGDIINFYRMIDNAPSVMHRVIRKEEGYILTRGDNTIKLDGFTLNENIKGYCAMIIY